MQLFTLLESFSSKLTEVLSVIQSIFFDPIGDALRYTILGNNITAENPLYGLKVLYAVLLSFRGAIDNALGIDLLFFLDFSLSSFLLPTVIIAFIVVLFVIAVWKLILELIPFA